MALRKSRAQLLGYQVHCYWNTLITAIGSPRSQLFAQLDHSCQLSRVTAGVLSGSLLFTLSRPLGHIGHCYCVIRSLQLRQPDHDSWVTQITTIESHRSQLFGQMAHSFFVIRVTAIGSPGSLLLGRQGHCYQDTKSLPIDKLDYNFWDTWVTTIGLTWPQLFGRLGHCILDNRITTIGSKGSLLQGQWGNCYWVIRAIAIGLHRSQLFGHPALGKWVIAIGFIGPLLLGQQDNQYWVTHATAIWSPGYYSQVTWVKAIGSPEFVTATWSPGSPLLAQLGRCYWVTLVTAIYSLGLLLFGHLVTAWSHGSQSFGNLVHRYIGSLGSLLFGLPGHR